MGHVTCDFAQSHYYLRMENEPAQRSDWKPLSITGIVLSAIYVFVICGLAATNGPLFHELKADGWATFISGIFSPLLFSGLCLAFFNKVMNSGKAPKLFGCKEKS